MRAIILYSMILTVFACSRSDHSEYYHVELAIDQEHHIPFILKHDPQTEHFSIVNGEELIDALTSKQINDSIDLEHNVYNASLRFAFSGDSLFGYWYNREKGRYKMPIRGWKDKRRFIADHQNNRSLNGKWTVNFGEGNDAYPAVGIFRSNSKGLSGTFLTETGDHRYLDGIYDGQRLMLSTFDLAHAFLFTAEFGEFGLEGRFYSGHHYQEKWMAVLDANAQLSSADQRVQLVDSQYQFSVRGLSNERIDLENPLFEQKAVIVQIFGSWCPNCYDESNHLKTLYPGLQEDSIELIGVAFERTHELEEAKTKLEKFRTGLDIPYPLAFGGYASKDTARAVFPFLDRVVAFPTLIFFDRDHQLIGIHSGFSGPANPEAYESTKKEIAELISAITPE